MTPSHRHAVEQLARLHGLQTSYIDMRGRRQRASPDVLLAVLRAYGLPLSSMKDTRAVLRDAQLRRQNAVIDSVIVAWDGKLRLSARGVPDKAELELTLEDGTMRRLLSSASLRPRLPLGYHRLVVHSRNEVHHATIIAAPQRAYSDLALRHTWGVFAPMYAIHSQRSWGAGNFRDWQVLADWVASLGGALVATLPLLAAFLDYPTCEPGPYSPASRLFWNEFYLDIESIPEFHACAPARQLANSPVFVRKLDSFRACPLIDWSEQWRARRAVLERLARHFFDSRRGARWHAFQQFATPEVQNFARFRATCEQMQKPWQQWPERMRQGNLRSNDFSRQTYQFHLYTQWLAQQHIEQLLDAGRRRRVQMYLDLPLGVHPASYDAWRHRDAFALNSHVGSPPDPTFQQGQDWAFAPLHPQRLRESGYRYLRDYLGFQMRHTGMLRIDHVMGLHRLYWIPAGHHPTEGAYVTYNADELYAIFCLESHRHKTMLVGEDLGTVPPEVPKRMARHRLTRMYVVHYSLHPKSSRALPLPAANSVASLNTHDMPPFAAFCQSLDITDRAALGLIAGEYVEKERRTREQLLRALRTFLLRRGLLAKDDRELPSLLRGTLEWLAGTPASVLLINLEDLWLETLPQNIPATSRQRPNWRRKTAYTLEQITTSRAFRELLTRIAAIRDL